MLRRLLLTVFLIGLAAPGVTAQDDQANTRIYVALYKISYADIPEWTEIYYEYSVPVLGARCPSGERADGGFQSGIACSTFAR